VCGDSIDRIVSNLNINEVSEFYLECVYPLNRCVSFVERERKIKHCSQIRHTGQEYETVQAVKCCRKADYGAINTTFGQQ